MAAQNWKLAYAGQDLPTPDRDGVQFTHNSIDDSARNANGDLFIQPITQKRSLSVRWSRLRGHEANALFALLEENRFGQLEFISPTNNTAQVIDAYHTSGSSASFFRYDDDMQKQLWSSVQLTFNEI